MKFSSIILGVIASVLFVFSACNGKDDEVTDYRDIDKKIIQDYIIANNLDADSTSSGLYYVIEKPGTGQTPNIYSNVKMKYKGYLTNGTVFDEAKTAVVFPLANLIPGWQEGIPKFKEGGEGILLVPSHLGYGNSATGSIPANSVLIFEITLEEVL